MRIPKEEAQKVPEIFGKVRILDAGIDDEYGFITLEMTEADYNEKAAQVHVLNMIRVTF